jgi:hypothetical protein
MAVFSARIGSDEDPIALTMGEDAASLLHTSSFLRQLESWKYSNPSCYINLQHHYLMDHNIITVPTYIYNGHAIAQAVSRRLPTAGAWV